MSRAYNFSPGPAALPDAVVYEAQQTFCEYADWRTSVMEISHRSEGFMQLYHHAESLLRELMHIDDTYAVLFLSGGATGQAAAVPLNLTGTNAQAAYAVSGHWSRRAAEEAQRFCTVQLAGDSSNTNYTTLPQLNVADTAAYLHIAENETVHGTEYPHLPESPVPIVADMSSNIATRVIDTNAYGLIYAGAQKNLGIAGITVVIVRRDLVQAQPHTPSVWDYQKQWQTQSMYNTPPTFAIYMLGLMLNWIKHEGGIAVMQQRSTQKAALLYDCLDESSFYRTAVTDSTCRSRINVPFFLADDALTAAFLTGADARGLLGLKGHKALGGIRASLYNSMPLAGVAALVEYMREFEQTNA